MGQLGFYQYIYIERAVDVIEEGNGICKDGPSPLVDPID